MASGRGSGRRGSGSRGSRGSRASGGSRSFGRNRHRRYGRGHFGDIHDGGFFAHIFMGISFIFMGIVVLIAFNTSIFGFDFYETQYKYDEEKIQHYTNDKYNEIYGDTNCYEDNILIVLLVEDEKYYDYYYCAWIGDHINSQYGNYFISDYSLLEQRMNNFDEYYYYTLDYELASIIDRFNEDISNGQYPCYICNCYNRDSISYVYNESRMNDSFNALTDAVNSFHEETGISMSFVIEDMDALFEKDHSGNCLRIITILLPCIFIIAGICLIVVIIKNKIKYEKEKKNNPKVNINYSDQVKEEMMSNSNANDSKPNRSEEKINIIEDALDNDNYKIDPNDY